MKINICPICTVVGSAWLLMSAGVAWGIFPLSSVIVPIALLMGGTVVGIAYLGEKRCAWAADHSPLWKTIEISGGMVLAYFFVTHLTKITVITELITMLIIAYMLFVKPSLKATSGTIRKLEEQMERCC